MVILRLKLEEKGVYLIFASWGYAISATAEKVPVIRLLFASERIQISH